MAISNFAFNPPDGWNNSTRFPTYEGSEEQVRADLQELHDQTRDYINSLAATLNDYKVDRAVILPASNARMKYLRLNSNHVLETSTNGTTWTAAGSPSPSVINANTATSIYGLIQGDGESIINGPIVIERNTDLDDLRRPGLYRCGNASAATTLQNCPPVYDGFGMLVFKIGSETVTDDCVQVIFSGYHVYLRRLYSDTSLESIWTEGSIDPAMTHTSLDGIVFGTGDRLRDTPYAIEDGDDLDGKAFGIHSCPSGTVAATLEHSPVTDDSFVMMVLRANESNDKTLQVVFSEGGIYTRMSDGDGDYPYPWMSDADRSQSFHSMHFSVPANSTRTLTFNTEKKEGLLIISGSTVKRAIYQFGSTSEGSLSLSTMAIVDNFQSGTSVTESGQTITLTNASTGLYCLLIQYYGGLPVISSV